MDPLTAQVLTQIGIQLGGQALGAVFGGEKQAPNYTAQAVNAGQNQLRQSRQNQQNALSQLQGQMNAAGATGFQGGAAREQIARASADEQASVRAGILDNIARAEMAEENARTQIHNQQVDQRRQGVYNMTSAAALAAANSDIGGGGGDNDALQQQYQRADAQMQEAIPNSPGVQNLQQQAQASQYDPLANTQTQMFMQQQRPRPAVPAQIQNLPTSLPDLQNKIFQAQQKINY